MKSIKYILVLVCLRFTVNCFAQTKDVKSIKYKAFAELISFEGGSKIQFAKFKIIKNLTEKQTLPDTVTVGYYFYKKPDKNLNYVVLDIEKYDGIADIKNYFICPNYDGKVGIQKANEEMIELYIDAFIYFEF